MCPNETGALPLPLVSPWCYIGSQDPPLGYFSVNVLVKTPPYEKVPNTKVELLIFPSDVWDPLYSPRSGCLFVAKPSAVFALLQSLLLEASPQRTQKFSCWEVACVEQQYDIYWARGTTLAVWQSMPWRSLFKNISVQFSTVFQAGYGDQKLN